MKYLEKMTRKRLGEMLVEEGLLSGEQLTETLKLQKKSSRRLGELLIDMGFVTEFDIARTISVQFQLPYILIKSYRLDRDLVLSIPKEILHKCQIVPIDKIEGILMVAMAGFMTDDIIAEIQEISKCELAIYVAIASEVMAVLNDICPLPLKKVTTRSRQIKKEEAEEEAAIAEPKPAAKQPPPPQKAAAPPPQKAAAPPPRKAAAPPQKAAPPPPQKAAPPPPRRAAPPPETAPPPAKRKGPAKKAARPPAAAPAQKKPEAPTPKKTGKAPGGAEIATIQTEEDGSKTYEISAPNVDDTDAWEKVIGEADEAVTESGEDADWLGIFDEAEQAVREELDKPQEDGE